MTRIFTEGAEFGDALFWSSIGTADASNGVSTTQKRSGSYAYVVNGVEGSTRWLEKQFTALSEFYYRFGVWPTAAQNQTMTICQAKSGGTAIGRLDLASDGTITIYVGSSGVASSTLKAPKGQWTLIEWHLKINDSSGVTEIKVDGVISGSYSGDTKPDANTTVDRFRHHSYNWELSYYDDLALNSIDNSDGKNDNSWPGEGRIELLMPNGNGSTNEWTGSDSNSTDNYLLVDEVPPSSSDYVEDSTPGNQDTYVMTDFTATNKQILRVWAECRAIDTVPEGAQMKIGFRTNSTDYLSSAKTLTTTYNRVLGDEHKVNPNDSAAWEDADLDGIELVLETV